MKLRLLFLILVCISNAMAAKSFLPKAFKADFMQKRKSIVSGIVKKSKITIKYQYPGNFYLSEGNASSTIYVCNKKKVWVYNPPFVKDEPGHLTIGSGNKHCYSKIFDSLQHGLVDNKTYKVKKITNTNYELTFLKEARAQLGVSSLNVHFKSKKTLFKDIKKLVIHYIKDENILTLESSSLESLTRFPPGTFSFKPPKNTDVTKM